MASRRFSTTPPNSSLRSQAEPADPSDFFQITDLEDVATEFTVIWPRVLGRTYTIQWATDLQTWVTGSTHLATGGAQSAVLDKTAMGNVVGTPGSLTKLFVRIEVVGP